MLLSGAAWQLSTAAASAFKWDTVERVVKDPSLLKDAFDQEKTQAAVKRWKRATNMVRGVGSLLCLLCAVSLLLAVSCYCCAGRRGALCARPHRGLPADAADAASYTVEYEEFKQAVVKVKKLKVGDKIIENPTEEELLKAWKEEEVRRAVAREKNGEEPLTRPVKNADGAVVYLVGPTRPTLPPSLVSRTPRPRARKFLILPLGLSILLSIFGGRSLPLSLRPAVPTPWRSRSTSRISERPCTAHSGVRIAMGRSRCVRGGCSRPAARIPSAGDARR